MTELRTTRAVVNALGGVEQVAILTRRKYNAAWNWTVFDHFPPDTYRAMKIALKQAGHTAPPSLWRQVISPKAPNGKVSAK